jgi:Xaa-Pro aminopeptidase
VAQLQPDLLEKKVGLVTEEMKIRDIDLWMLFVRDGVDDPVASQLGLAGSFARTLGVIDADGSRTAIAWVYDAEPLKQKGFYHDVIPYTTEGPAVKLREFVNNRRPKRIAVNTSIDAGFADGLTSGMREYLTKALDPSKLVSGEDLVITLRSRLLPEEVAKVKRSIDETEQIFRAAEVDAIRVGKTDKEIHEWILDEVRRRGLVGAWTEDACPSVIVGTDPVGHVGYYNTPVGAGDFVRIDFGVVRDGYCSDLQRDYVVGGGALPTATRTMFETARRANDSAIFQIKPNTPGYVVDAAARDTVVGGGYPDFAHGTGHALGLFVHEIGPRLAPRKWDLYGDLPEKKLKPGMIFTVEPSIKGATGMCNLEQDVLVTDKGSEEISTRQESIIQLG